MDVFKQNYIRYGLIMVGILVLCLLSMEITGNNKSFDKSPLFIVYQFIAPAVIWFWGIREEKKKHHGKLTFKQGVKEGIKISFVFALVSPFIFLLYYTLINPGIVDYVRTTYNFKGLDNTTIIAVDMMAQFVFAIIFGTLYSAIIAFFLKTKP